MKMIYMVSEHIIGLTKEFIQEIGKRIKCMAKALLLGKMGENIQE